jgi:hypothetical protein
MGSGVNRSFWSEKGTRSGRKSGTKSGGRTQAKTKTFLRMKEDRAEAKRRAGGTR